MDIVLISFCIPTSYNVRTASALPYHLLKGLRDTDEKLNIKIYSYNTNEIDAAGILKAEKALGANIILIKSPYWQKWMFKLHLLTLRTLLHYPLGAYFKMKSNIIERIINDNPDIIWIYGEELMGLARCFQGYKKIITMPDCESMYYYRLLRKRFATRSLKQIFRYSFAYWQYRSMERDFLDNETLYHFVGEKDNCFFKGINPTAKTKFLPHPLYQRSEAIIQNHKFHNPLRIVIAGRYDIYQKEATDELIEALIQDKAKTIKDNYVITFLGKSWDIPSEKLKAAGWKTLKKTWVEDYGAELRQNDIGIYPISVGTGTKGKVLDALSNGLLVIGTPYAMENIAVEDGKSCIEYHDAYEVITCLKDIVEDKEKYESIAREGMVRVNKYHNRVKITEELFVNLQQNS